MLYIREKLNYKKVKILNSKLNPSKDSIIKINICRIKLQGVWIMMSNLFNPMKQGI